MALGGNERAFRRMMKALKLRDADITEGGDPVLGSLARNGLELAKLLDGTLEPRDRVASVRELRQLTDRLHGAAPIKRSMGGSVADVDIDDDDDFDTPVR